MCVYIYIYMYVYVCVCIYIYIYISKLSVKKTSGSNTFLIIEYCIMSY